MAKSVTDVDELQRYILGVMTRADHHAGEVNETVLALAGAIVWKKDNQSIKVMARDGETKNVLWVNIGSSKYAFSYNHDTQKIEMRKGSIQGSVIKTFDNHTPLSVIRQTFDAL